MAGWLTVSDVLERVMDDSRDVSEGKDSDYEGEGIQSYLPTGSLGAVTAEELEGDCEEGRR